MNAIKRLTFWQKAALAGVIYAILIAILTWPAIRSLGEGLIGNNEDVWIFYWNNWWLKEALSRGYDFFFTPYLFFPLGTSLVAHSNSYLSSLFAALIDPLVGPVAAYNLVLLLGLWIGALGMYLLVEEITDSMPAAIIAGFVFAFAPYHLSQVLAHAHLGSIHWWPFFALFLIKTLRSTRWRDAAMTGIFGALSVWSGLQLAVLLMLWTLLFLTWFIWTERDAVWRDKEFRTRLVSRLGMILVTTTLLVLPLILTLLSHWSEVSGDTSSIDESMYKQTDLAAYVTPSPYNPLWNDQINPVYDRFPYHRGFTPYIGFTVLVLIIAAAVGWRKKALFWLVSAGAWILLASGPVLRMNGDLFENIPLPYRWLREVFPISTIRASDRFNLLLVFTMAVLVGLGAAYLVRLRWGRWLLASASIFLVLEYLPIPIPMMELPQISGFIEEMADDDDVYALVDYPLGYSNAKRWLYYQTIHGKPTVDGHVSRYSDGIYAYLASQPILNALYQGGEKPRYLSAGYMDGNGKPVVDLGPQIRALSEDGIRYALVHLPVTSYERLQHIKSILPFVFSFRDDSLLVYDLSRPLLHSYEPYPITVARGLELAEAVPRLKEDGSMLSVDFLVKLNDESAQGADCRMELGDSAVSAPFTLFADMSEWQEGDLTQVNVDLALPDHIQNGVYTWRLRCADGEPVIGNENLYVDDEDRGLFSQVLDLTYGDIIALDGYHKWYEGGDMHLMLQWRALSEIDQDYKVFIHVLDEDGGIAAQSDFVHCSGDCPSSQWLIDQRVRDEATLNLGGLPPGDYRLAVGLYNGDSGERLEVSRGDGSVVPDAYYVLDEKVITREKRPVWP